MKLNLDYDMIFKLRLMTSKNHLMLKNRQIMRQPPA